MMMQAARAKEHHALRMPTRRCLSVDEYAGWDPRRRGSRLAPCHWKWICCDFLEPLVILWSQTPTVQSPVYRIRSKHSAIWVPT